MKTSMGAALGAFFLSLYSCTIPAAEFKGNAVLLKPRGETIEIQTEQQAYGGEFLFGDASAVFLLDASGILSVPLTEIRSLKVLGVSNRSWTLPVVLTQIVPALLLGLAAGMADADAASVTAGASVPGLVSGLFLALSTPAIPTLKGGVTYEALKGFQKYARFPYTPSTEQRQKLLEALEKKAPDR